MTFGGISRRRALSYAAAAFALITVLLAVQAFTTHARGFQGLAILSFAVSAILAAGTWAAGLPPRDVVDRDEEEEWSRAIR